MTDEFESPSQKVPESAALPSDVVTRPHYKYSPAILQTRGASTCYDPRNDEFQASQAGTLHQAFETEDPTLLILREALVTESPPDDTLTHYFALSRGITPPDTLTPSFTIHRIISIPFSSIFIIKVRNLVSGCHPPPGSGGFPSQEVLNRVSGCQRCRFPPGVDVMHEGIQKV